jgi:hypothetical protein
VKKRFDERIEDGVVAGREDDTEVGRERERKKTENDIHTEREVIREVEFIDEDDERKRKRRGVLVVQNNFMSQLQEMVVRDVGEGGVCGESLQELHLNQFVSKL